MTQATIAHAKQLLDRAIELDKLTTGAFYEMGQLLSAIEHGKLWQLLEYRSFAHLVEEEFTFHVQTAYNYVNVYRGFRRLKYTKLEALALIRTYGVWKIMLYLREAKQKQSNRAVRKAIEAIAEKHRSVNFTLSKEDWDEVMDLMGDLGLERSPSGRALNSSETFLYMVRLCREKVGKDKPKLKAVS